MKLYLMFCSTLLFGLLLNPLAVFSDCEDCTPGDDETDCCSYYDEYFEYCEDEIGDITYFDCNDTDHDTNNTNTTVTGFDCDFGWDVDFVGKSGQFKIYPCSNSNFFIKIKTESIQGYDSDGDKQSTNKVSSFSYASANSASYSSGNSSVYSWSDADGNDITFGGVTLNYQFEVGKNDTLVTFIMNVLLIDEITEISYMDSENVTYNETLSEGTIKFDYTIVNWPFDNDDDQLAITMKMNTGGTTNDGENDDSNDGTSAFSWGDDFVVKMPEIYSHSDVNGSETSGTVNVTCESNSSGKQADCIYLFLDAGDAHTIVYDPWVTTSDESNAVNVVKSISISIVALLMVACFMQAY